MALRSEIAARVSNLIVDLARLFDRVPAGTLAIVCFTFGVAALIVDLAAIGWGLLGIAALINAILDWDDGRGRAWVGVSIAALVAASIGLLITLV